MPNPTNIMFRNNINNQMNDALHSWITRQDELRQQFFQIEDACEADLPKAGFDHTLAEFKHPKPLECQHILMPIWNFPTQKSIPVLPFRLCVRRHEGLRHKVPQHNQLIGLSMPLIKSEIDGQEHLTSSSSSSPVELFFLDSIFVRDQLQLVQSQLHYLKPTQTKIDLDSNDLLDGPFSPEIANCFVQSIVGCERMKTVCSSLYLEQFKISFIDGYEEKEAEYTSPPNKDDIPYIAESLSRRFSSCSIPGSVVVSIPVFLQYPKVVQELMMRRHELIDRPSYDQQAWIYTSNHRFILTDNIRDAMNNIASNVSLIWIHNQSALFVGRGDIERCLEGNIGLHHAANHCDVVNIIESFGVVKMDVGPETAWQRFAAIHKRDRFNPFK